MNTICIRCFHYWHDYLCEILLKANVATDEGNGLNESWRLNKRWNWSSYAKLALSVSWSHGLRAQSVRAFKRNSLVVSSNHTQASNLTIIYSYYIYKNIIYIGFEPITTEFYLDTPSFLKGEGAGGEKTLITFPRWGQGRGHFEKLKEVVEV